MEDYNLLDTRALEEKGSKQLFKLGPEDSEGVLLCKMDPMANCMAYHSLLVWTINSLREKHNLSRRQLVELLCVMMRVPSSAAFH